MHKELDDTLTEVKFLTRDEIYASRDIVTEAVEVPEWGGKVMVKALTGAERDRFEGSLVTGVGKAQKISTNDIRAKLCAWCIVDAKGTPIFTQADVATLSQKSAAALDRVYDVAARLSKISKEDVDELAGNSDSGLSDNS